MRKKMLRYAVVLIFLGVSFFANAQEVKDSICLTPPMGWNSWNFFEEKVSESLLREIADAMASNGMKAAGYEYIIIDDHWMSGRDSKNVLVADRVRFPNGIKALADYIHSKG